MPRTKQLPLATMMRPQNTAIDHLPGYNLKRVYMLFRDTVMRSMSNDRMTPRAFSALSLVIEMPGITQSSLARQLGVERSGLVALIDELERLGYLKRCEVPDDRRTLALLPTAEGRAAAKKALDTIAKSEADLLSVLSATEQRQFLDMLQRIRAFKKEE